MAGDGSVLARGRMDGPGRTHAEGRMKVLARVEAGRAGWMCHPIRSPWPAIAAMRAPSSWRAILVAALVVSLVWVVADLSAGLFACRGGLCLGVNRLHLCDLSVLNRGRSRRTRRSRSSACLARRSSRTARSPTGSASRRTPRSGTRNSGCNRLCSSVPSPATTPSAVTGAALSSTSKRLLLVLCRASPSSLSMYKMNGLFYFFLWFPCLELTVFGTNLPFRFVLFCCNFNHWLCVVWCVSIGCLVARRSNKKCWLFQFRRLRTAFPDSPIRPRLRPILRGITRCPDEPFIVPRRQQKRRAVWTSR